MLKKSKLFKKQTFDEQKFWSKNILVQNFGMKTMFCSKNIFVQTHIGINDTKRFKVQTLWSILGLVLGQGEMLSGQRFIVQMSSVVWHLSKKAQENLNLKFCQNWFSNSWDITDIEFSGGGGGGWRWVVGGDGGVQSHINV